jgi:hypothetical protein
MGDFRIPFWQLFIIAEAGSAKEAAQVKSPRALLNYNSYLELIKHQLKDGA